MALSPGLQVVIVWLCLLVTGGNCIGSVSWVTGGNCMALSPGLRVVIVWLCLLVLGYGW